MRFSLATVMAVSAFLATTPALADTNNIVDNSSLVARDLSHTGVSTTNSLEERGLISDILGSLLGGHSSRNYPSRSFKCRGDGSDGYKYDWQGNALPRGYPVGFLWFGVDIGWAPPRQWAIPSISWSPPEIWISSSSCSKATWWAPARRWGWKGRSGWKSPSFWHQNGWLDIELPNYNWVCSGNGNDGQKYDWQGKTCPSTYPKGWLWYGVTVGWQPPKGWVPTATWTPPTVWLKTCGHATWWAPPSSWKWTISTGVTVPSFWHQHGWTGVVKVKFPSKSWTCNGKGTDGQKYDWQGKTCPSTYPKGWLWYGVTVGWQPPKGWVPTATWTPPTAWLKTCGHATWWAPPSSWKWTISTGLTVPSFWHQHGWTGVVKIKFPSKSWTCSGKGTDGQKYDWQGKTCPSTYPKGWLWYGVTVGWQPPKGWVPTATWTPPTAWFKTCGHATWWAPPSSWKWAISTGVTVPSFWHQHGWTGVVKIKFPSKSWTCNGKGTDGQKYDWQGKTLPKGYPKGWLWYGVTVGWQPYPAWKVPSASWVPPTAWIKTCSKAIWWKPQTTITWTWTISLNFAAPSHWQKHSTLPAHWSTSRRSGHRRSLDAEHVE